MKILIRLYCWIEQWHSIDFLAPLLLRLYLVPVFWMAGTQKLAHFSDTVAWFGDAEWGLGLPMPWLMALLAVATEIVGTLSLLLGLAVRWFVIPLMFTMAIAATTVHWNNGWLAIAESSRPFATERTMEAAERLDRAKEILREHGDYEYLTEYGDFVILNNGIEFAATYFVMLLALAFSGGGRFVSADYWIAQAIRRRYQRKGQPDPLSCSTQGELA